MKRGWLGLSRALAVADDGVEENAFNQDKYDDHDPEGDVE